MFPLVPYHALPKLHELVKNDYPTPSKSIIDAFREIVPAVRKQMKDPTYFVDRRLPDGAGRMEDLQHQKKSIKEVVVKNGKVEVCKIEDLPKGEVIRVDFEQKTFAVYRTSFDNYYATEGNCSHGNAHLADGVVIEEMIECAKHNGRFDLKDGSPKRIPVCVGVKTFQAEVVDNKVVLDLEEVRSRTIEKSEKRFKVVNNKNVATYIKELELEPVNGTLDYQPGQYIHLSIPPHNTSFSEFVIDDPYGNTWEEQGLFESRAANEVYSKRNYSMATNPDRESHVRFNIRIALSPDIKAIDAGVGSSYVFSLKEGEEVKLTGPFGDFLIKDSKREMIYLGGGAGMAPIRSHVSHLFETQKTDRKVSYWYGARSLSELFYTEYFKSLEKEHPNFSFNMSLSEPDEKDNWNGHTGFIHQCLLDNYLRSHPNPNEIEYYLCGPPAMVKAAQKMLADLGVQEEMIAFDEF